MSLLSQGCIPQRLLGRPDVALGGGNQGPSAPGWARQHHSQRDPPFVPSKRLPDWVLEKTLENPLDTKDIKPVNPKGNQS